MSALSPVRRPLPRSWSYAVLAITMSTAVVCIANVPRMHVYL